MKVQKIILTAFFLGATTLTFAQDTASQSGTDPHLMQKILFGSIFAGGIIVIVGAVFTLLKLSNILTKNIVNQYLTEQGRAPQAEGTEAVAPQESWWTRLNQRLTDVVPIEKEEAILSDHAFDGIRELDNKLPPWWVGMFYITIAIGVAYFSYYHIFNMGDSSIEQYEKEMAKAEEQKQLRLASLAAQVDENTVTMLADAGDIEAGASTFITYCAACHGGAGEGGVGPNMTDQYWIHGGSIKDVFKTIKYGVPAKGMIAWESQMTPRQMQQVASYILTLKGTNPPNAKEPQGELYVESESTTAVDSSGLSLLNEGQEGE